MLDDITELRTFAKIVAAGSLSAAGREMGISLSVVSKRLATLERRTDTSLIVRSTRHLALTEEGQRLFDRAQRILAEVDEAEASLTHGRVEPQGVLRVSATVALGRAHVSPVCRDLALAHPKMSVELMLTDRLVELIDERIDVLIRIGMPRDSDLIMRKLIDNHRIIAASPAYVMRHGTPASPEDLTQHDCLLYNRGAQARWRLVHSDGRVQYPIAFMVYLPDQLPIHLKVMYTRPVTNLAATFKVNKHIMLDEPETLTLEWLNEQLDIVVK